MGVEWDSRKVAHQFGPLSENAVYRPVQPPLLSNGDNPSSSMRDRQFVQPASWLREHEGLPRSEWRVIRSEPRFQEPDSGTGLPPSATSDANDNVLYHSLPGAGKRRGLGLVGNRRISRAWGGSVVGRALPAIYRPNRWNPRSISAPSGWPAPAGRRVKESELHRRDQHRMAQYLNKSDEVQNLCSPVLLKFVLR